MTSRSYFPDIYDPILTELNQKWRRTDQDIADEMGFDKYTIWKNRNRLRLPTNWRPRPVQHPSDKYLKPPPDRPNPVQVAEFRLGKRLTIKNSMFWLDGRPASLETVMKAANALLKRDGLEQAGPEKWRV